MALAIDPSLLGFRVRGDIDGYTVYTDRFGRKVWYKKAPPDKPPSPLQLTCRARFRTAVMCWRNLPESERDKYEIASKVLCLCMTGHNLFVHLCLRGDQLEWIDLCRSSDENLAQPPFVRWW